MAGGEPRRRPCSGGAALDGAGKRLEPAVEEGRLVADRAEEPDEAGGDDAAAVVVGDDHVVVADAGEAQAVREGLGGRQRVAPRRRRGGAGEPPLEVHEDGAREVSTLVGVAPHAPVQVPAHVGEDDVVAPRLEPARIDDRRDHDEAL